MRHTATVRRSSAETVAQLREELFSHILRSGMTAAPAEQRRTWLDETLRYLAERYEVEPGLLLDEVRRSAERFCDAGARQRRSA